MLNNLKSLKGISHPVLRDNNLFFYIMEKKKFNLKLKKETITTLQKEEQRQLNGGADTFLTSLDQDLAKSRVACLTIKPQWDCGGSKTCQAFICIPF